MKQNRAITGIVLLACLCAAGCTAIPMNYAEWKSAQDERTKFAQAGIPYKSPSELRDEAAAMRNAGQDTAFARRTK